MFLLHSMIVGSTMHLVKNSYVMITTVIMYNMATTLVLSVAYFPTLDCCSGTHLKAVLQ